MKKRNTKILDKESMQKLNTRRLLKYKQALLRNFNESPDWDMGCSAFFNKSRISKSDHEWKEAYSTCKQILSKRENIE